MLGSTVSLTTTKQRFSILVPIVLGGNNNFNLSTAAETGDVIHFSNVCLFDLTRMFGAGKEPATVDEFKALFPLSYYKYDTGSLLNFTGTKVKTTGRNLVFKILSNANISGGGSIVADNQNLYDLAVAEVACGCQYHIGNNRQDSAIIGWFTNEPQIGSTAYDGQRIIGSPLTVVAPINGYIVFRLEKPFNSPTFNLGNTATNYEPYTDNETDLPISAFFPTGMKSAGTVYDELTPTRAITRIGSIDLGTLTWERLSDSYPNTFSAIVSDIYNRTSGTENHAVCSKYESENVWLSTALSDKKFMIRGDVKRVYIHDSLYSDAQTFKTAMSGVMLNYELAVEDVQPTMSFDTE